MTKKNFMFPWEDFSADPSEGQAAQAAFNIYCYKFPDSTFCMTKDYFFMLDSFQHYYSLVYGIFYCLFLYLMSLLLKN